MVTQPQDRTAITRNHITVLEGIEVTLNWIRRDLNAGRTMLDDDGDGLGASLAHLDEARSRIHKAIKRMYAGNPWDDDDDDG